MILLLWLNLEWAITYSVTHLYFIRLIIPSNQPRPLSFMDVSVHCCCHKAPACHSAEQQKQYDEKSHMALKKILWKRSLYLQWGWSHCYFFSMPMNRELNVLRNILERRCTLCQWWNHQIVSWKRKKTKRSLSVKAKSKNKQTNTTQTKFSSLQFHKHIIY